MHSNFRPCFANIHEVAHVSLPRATVAVFQNRKMVMTRKEAHRVIRACRIQI